MNPLSRPSLIATLACGLPLVAVPQPVTHDSERAIAARCTSGLSHQSKLAPLYGNANLIEVTCRCAGEKIVGDPTLREHLQSITPLSHPISQPQPFSALSATVLACAAQAIAQLPSETARSIPNYSSFLTYALVSESQLPKFKAARVKSPEKCRPGKYPEVAERASAEGVTVLEYSISAAGLSTGVSVVQSSGDTAAHKLLDYAALISGTTCRFEAAEENDKPVAGTARLQFVWNLK